MFHDCLDFFLFLYILWNSNDMRGILKRIDQAKCHLQIIYKYAAAAAVAEFEKEQFTICPNRLYLLEEIVDNL